MRPLLKIVSGTFHFNYLVWASMWTVFLALGFFVSTFIPILETIDLYESLDTDTKTSYYITYDDQGKEHMVFEEKKTLKPLPPL
jgi:hypothetical protein